MPTLERETGAVKRKERKFSCQALVVALCQVARRPNPCLRALALSLAALVGTVVSKQAVWKRLTPGLCRLLRTLVTDLLRRCIWNVPGVDQGVFRAFNRVLLQDSTCVSLPGKLVRAFPGPRNQSGGQKAALKLQTVFDLKHDHYVSVELGPFTRNDQSAAGDIISILKKGDLVIRDLGYFVLDVFASIARTEAFFLSRLHYSAIVLDPADGRPIDLLKRLRREGSVDLDVLLGKKERLPVRLIARPVPKDVAAQRRRVARQNRDRRCNPGAERLALLGWEVFVTNVGRDVWPPDIAVQVYGFRWRIEILFKMWKSHLALTELPLKASESQVTCLALARIAQAIVLHRNIHALTRYWLPTQKQSLSLLKTAAFFLGQDGDRYLQLAELRPDLLMELMRRHCAYEKRRRCSFGTIFALYGTSAAMASPAIQPLPAGGTAVVP